MDSASATKTFGYNWLSWAYDGVDPSIAGNGGEECMALIPTEQKVVETVVFVLVGVIQISYAWQRVSISDISQANTYTDTIGRRILLMAMCLVFGAEIGFKLASRQLIWIFNQCHVITMLQIYLLVAPPSKFVSAIFRFQMHCLNGATVAILFPILNTRSLPFEIEIYYIQHAMMLVIPAYLLRQRGAYTPEPLSDYSWVYLTIGILLVYHWLPLQSLALLSHVNINNMMCPAVSDPFHGRWYRIAAAGHQTLLVIMHGKAYVYMCSLLFRDTAQGGSFDENAHIPTDSADHSNGWVMKQSPGEDSLVHANGFMKID